LFSAGCGYMIGSSGVIFACSYFSGGPWALNAALLAALAAAFGEVSLLYTP